MVDDRDVEAPVLALVVDVHQLNAFTREDLHAGRGRRRRKQKVAEQDVADVGRVHAVEVLYLCDGVEHRVLVDLARHRHQGQDAVHGRVGVEPGDQRQHVGLARAGRQGVVEVVEAHRGGVLLDLAAVELGAAVVADEDGRDARLDAARGELLDLGDDLGAHLLGDRLAVDDLRCHVFPVLLSLAGARRVASRAFTTCRA